MICKSKKSIKYFIKIIFVSIILIISFNAKNVYGNEVVASSSNLSNGLTSEEIEEIAEYKDLQEMVGQIFDISGNLGTDDLSNPIKLMLGLVNRIIAYWDKNFTDSSLYRLLVGLALIFLVANFSIKMYEEMQAGVEVKINSNLMIKKYIQFIFAILMIVNIEGMVMFVLGFFRFILNLSINITEGNFIGTPENIAVLDKERVAYEILKQNGIVKSNTLLDEVIIRSKESAIRTMYIIPWVFSWISKLALVVVIFVNSINLFVHCAFYVVAVGDFMGDIKRSKFIEYTKILIALVLEEAVIVVVLYLSNLLLNPYLQNLLLEGVSDKGISFLTLAMIFTGLQMSKVFVIVSSSIIAKKIVGV